MGRVSDNLVPHRPPPPFAAGTSSGACSPGPGESSRLLVSFSSVALFLRPPLLNAKHSRFVGVEGVVDQLAYHACQAASLYHAAKRWLQP